MLKTLFASFSGTLLLFSALHSQTRTWGFSANAVYEFESGGPDTVTLFNQGVDTLRFDTVYLEIVRPGTTTYGVGFSRLSPYVPYVLNCSNGTCSQSPNPKSIVIAPAQSVHLDQFLIDLKGSPLVAKRQVSVALGDTMQARLIFQAMGGRGRDTLIVHGTQQTTVIRAMRPYSNAEQPEKGSHFFDLRGRRVENKIWHKMVSP
jgi:hypothetical protein